MRASSRSVSLFGIGMSLLTERLQSTQVLFAAVDVYQLLKPLHQVHDPLLSCCVSLNVPLGHTERAMARKHLHVTQ